MAYSFRDIKADVENSERNWRLSKVGWLEHS